jgi:hypothetical protein
MEAEEKLLEDIRILNQYHLRGGHAAAQLVLRQYATSHNVAGSILDVVIGFFN